MNRLLRIILPLILLSSCKTTMVTRYMYVAEEPIHLYEFPSFSGGPVVSAAPGDTVYATGTETIHLGGPVPVEYKGYRFYSPSAKARFIRTVKIDSRLDTTASGLSYIPRMQMAKQQRELAIKKAGEYMGDWYGQLDKSTPVLGDFYAFAKQVATLPTGTIIKIKRHSYNYWQVVVDDIVGYISVDQINLFSKTATPFVKTAYTGSQYGPWDGESSPRTNTPTTGATIHTGPRGGRYYYNSNGNKTYIKRK